MTPRSLLRLIAALLLLGCGLNATMAATALVPYQAAGGQWGYLDAKTRTPVIAPQFMDARPFRNGLGRVSYPNPHSRSSYDNTLYDFVRADGKLVFPERFLDINPVEGSDGQPGLSQLRQVTVADGRMGVVSLKTGRWVVRPFRHQGNRGPQIRFYSRERYLVDGRYLMADGQRIDAPRGTVIVYADFKHHVLHIGKRDSDDTLLKGLASWQGKVLIPPRYLSLEYFPELERAIGTRFRGTIASGIATFLFSHFGGAPKWTGKRELLTRTGKVLRSFSASADVSRLRGDIGIVDSDDDPEHLHARYFSLVTGQDIPAAKVETADGYRIFHSGASGNIRYGLKAAAGNVLIPARYAHLQFINHQLLIARDPSTYKDGVVNIHGKTIIPFNYRTLDLDGAGRVTASRDGHLFGVIDLAGRAVIPPLSDHEILFYHGRADVYRGSLQGVLAESGQLLVPIKYESLFDTQAMEHTRAIYYVAQNRAGKWGLLDAHGKVVVPFEYGFVDVDKDAFAQGWVRVEDAGRHHYGLVNFRTGVQIPPEYDSVEVFPDCIAVTRYDATANTSTHQLLDFAGQPISAAYSDLDPIAGGRYFIVHKNRQAGVLSDAGKLVVPLQYRRLWDRGEGYLEAETAQGHNVYVDVHGHVYTPVTGTEK